MRIVSLVGASFCLAVQTAAAVSTATANLLTSRFAKAQELHSDKLKNGSYTPTFATTAYGVIEGLDDGVVRQFLGVPFASPPVGDLRWKAPIPPAPWGGVKNTTWFGDACPQTESYWGILNGVSEDCLYLHIYIPSGNRTPPAVGYPMMLFWYGGSWEFGASGFPLYDGEKDVHLVEDVIVATSNYRLNAFGFLAGDDLLAESPDGSVGNYGFQDQRAALQFLKGNAAAFGGNPDRITIFGESAGGGSVSNHLVSPRSMGLFSGAIIESGPWAAWTAQPYNISKSRWPQMAEMVGCGSAAPGAARLACMRAVPMQTLLDHYGNTTHGFIQFSPVIDGVEVIDDPRALAAAGKIAPVPILLGTNYDEGTIFTKGSHQLAGGQEYLDAIAAVIGADLAPTIAVQYPPTLYNGTLSASSAWWTLSHVLGDAQMTCAARQSARWMTSPSRQGGPQKAFVYFFKHTLDILQVATVVDPIGCCHASELLLVFDFTVGLAEDGETELARTVVKYWTNFAIYGDPNGDAADPNPPPAWPEYGGAAVDVVAGLDINSTAKQPLITPLVGLKKQSCDFWANITIPPTVVFGRPY